MGKKKAGKKESGTSGKKGMTVPTGGTVEKRRDSNREKSSG